MWCLGLLEDKFLLKKIQQISLERLMPFTSPWHNIFCKTTFNQLSTSLQRHIVSQSILIYRFACIYTSTALWPWYFLGFLWHHPESLLVKEPDFHVYPSMFLFSKALRYTLNCFAESGRTIQHPIAPRRSRTQLKSNCF